MKNSSIQKIFLALSFCLFVSAAEAQTINYTWDQFGVKFAIPQTHEVKNSTASEFTSGDNLTWLHMEPYKDYSETAKGMVDRIAAENNYRILGQGAYTSGGYDGYWIRCSADTHPDWLYWVIGFIDPNSDTNFYATIWWKKGNTAAYNIAHKMSYSFQKMN